MTTRKSRWLGIAVIIFLLVAFSTLLAAVAIATMSAESYPARGTFRYKIYVAPTWRDGTDKKVIALYYGSLYEIAEKPLAEVNAKLLRVTSTGYSGNGNRLSIAYFYGNLAGQGGTIFEAIFHGPELPFPYPFTGSCEIDVIKIISQANIINGSINITMMVYLDDITAFVSSSDLKRASIRGEFKPQITKIIITVLNGNPSRVQSGNVTVTQTAELPVDEWVVEDSMELYNPSVVMAKEAIPTIITITTILLVMAAVSAVLKK